MNGDKNKKGPIHVYESTLKDVRDYIKGINGMTIVRFYDEAAQEKLKRLKNVESTAQPIRGENDRKAD